MFAASIVLSLLASRLVFAESGYSQWPKDCSIVNINHDTSRPGIGGQCEKPGGDLVPCQAEFDAFLVNEQGILKPRPSGAASESCSEYSLLGTVLAADCGGPAVALIDLGPICKSNDGKLQCGQQQSSTGPTTTSGQASSSMPSSPSGASDGSESSQTSIPVHTSTSIPSPSTSVTSTMSAMSTTSSAASIPTGSADSCGSYQKRMRIMDRSNEM